MLVILVLWHLDLREGSPVLCFELVAEPIVGPGELKIIRTFGKSQFCIIHSARVLFGIPF